MRGKVRVNLTDCQPSSQQVKSEFTSHNFQVISVSKLCLSNGLWVLLAATTVVI